MGGRLEQYSKVRMGMIGGGAGAFIGSVHRHAIMMDGYSELVCGAFSRDADNNQQTSAQFGINKDRVYDSWQSLIEGESTLPEKQRMQVLVIVTPNHMHVPIAQKAIQHGFHVFCEKPLAISLDEAELLAQRLKNTPVLFGLAHTYLGYPMVWQAQHLVASGAIGSVRKIIVEYPQGWLSANEEQSNKQAAWRTDPAQSGGSGCMGDIGTHAFGMAEFVTQHQISDICAELNIHIDGRRLDDDGAALFKTKQGATGTLIASQVCAGVENGLSIRVYGDKGGIEWQQMQPDTLIHRRTDAPFQVYRAGQGNVGLCAEAMSRCRVPAGHPEGYLEAMANLYSMFAKAVTHHQDHPVINSNVDGVPSIYSGLRGMAFIQTMLESAASDKKWTAFVASSADTQDLKNEVIL